MFLRMPHARRASTTLQLLPNLRAGLLLRHICKARLWSYGATHAPSHVQLLWLHLGGAFCRADGSHTRAQLLAHATAVTATVYRATLCAAHAAPLASPHYEPHARARAADTVALVGRLLAAL